jgi:hypothetical protein
MASAFKSKISTAIGTSLATVYTVPAVTTATVIGMSVANVSASPITVDVQLVKGGVTVAYLVKGAPIPVGSSLVVVGGDQKVVAETTDLIKVISSVAASADAILSVLELT